jgi:hypothetical protein
MQFGFITYYINIFSGPIAILDPDGLRREVDHWRSQVSELQQKNYDLEVQLAQSKNERRKLQLKVKAITKSRFVGRHPFYSYLNFNSVSLLQFVVVSKAT